MIPNFMITILAFIVGLGVLITFHEFGHFWVAKRCGVKVLCFSVGFGKALVRWFGKDGTEYRIAIIPLGGYVKMLGEQDEIIAPADQSRAFNQKSVWVRSAIVAAGPIFNFIFAFFAYWVMLMMGTQGVIPVIGDLKPGSIAEEAGLRANQEIVSIDGKPTRTWQEVLNGLVSRLGDKGELKIGARPLNQTQAPKNYLLPLSYWDVSAKDPDLIGALGIVPFRPASPAVLDEVIEGEAAMRAGLLPGDQIIEIAGKPVSNPMILVAELLKRPNVKTELTVKRDNKIQSIFITPTAKAGKEGDTGYIGIKLKAVGFPKELIRIQKYSALESIGLAYDKTVYYTSVSFKLIGKMLMGKISASNLSGPISIAQGAGATLQAGFQYYLGFLALISVSLGVVNLLPIPILDGGHLLFYALEVIIRRPVPQKIQQLGFNIGLLLILGLMTISFYNDIMRLI